MRSLTIILLIVVAVVALLLRLFGSPIPAIPSRATPAHVEAVKPTDPIEVIREQLKESLREKKSLLQTPETTQTEK